MASSRRPDRTAPEPAAVTRRNSAAGSVGSAADRQAMCGPDAPEAAVILDIADSPPVTEDVVISWR